MPGLLNVLEREFMAICDLLEKSPEKIREDVLIIPKEELRTLLERNKYEPAVRKIKSWKTLKWIRTDGKRLTKRIYDKTQKKYCPYIQIERRVYQQMKKLFLQESVCTDTEELCSRISGGPGK